MTQMDRNNHGSVVGSSFQYGKQQNRENLNLKSLECKEYSYVIQH